MEPDSYQIKMNAESVFDPPGAAPGWYIFVWIQIGNNPRYGMRFGPIEAEHIEAARQDLYEISAGTPPALCWLDESAQALIF